ncbi:rho guanine nucleotide exchange factor 2-like [Mustelus asterias]
MNSDPEVGLSLNSDPETGLSLNPDPETRLSLNPDPGLSLNSDPETGLSMNSDPEMGLSLYSNPETGLSMNSDPETDLSLNSDPETRLTLNSDPERGLSLNSDPERSPFLNPDPATGLSLNSDPQTGLFLNSDPQTGLFLNSDPQTGLFLNSDPVTGLNSEPSRALALCSGKPCLPIAVCNLSLSVTDCSVTIHKSCKDSLSSCTKVKQKQLKAAQVKNNSALQSVSMRHKVPLGRERPNSAIYPSDSLRQSPLFSQLGSRRGRTAFQSLSKSVSTNNIGNLNDDTPLGIRRILSQSTDSLNMRNRTLSIESLIDEGAEVIYQQLMGDLDLDERYFEADSWSLAVDTSFLQQHKKDVMKRQDVIYELIQTEVHHMRTLKIMSDLFRKGMLEELQMDRGTVDTIFPALDDLIQCHVHFLSQLLERRKESLFSDSDKNFVINRLGDILLNQFSGQSAELMRRAYAEFCSRHTKAVKLYKELYTRDKRFQQFVRRMTRSSVLRRHGIQECILLVTQRITKYPVLFDRILHNTKGNEEDRRDLSNSLTLVKELISAVDQEVHECEKRFRLQDIYNRMDTKTVAVMHGGRQFRREDLIRRKLVHDGFVLWKTLTGRFKDIQVLLLTDVLIFLHEKDQRYSFPVLDNKPAVIPLHKLIVRDIANQEKGMFLISAAAQTPEMYEIHTASKDERNTWMKVILQSVNV